jgi:hypothetical protein
MKVGGERRSLPRAVEGVMDEDDFAGTEPLRRIGEAGRSAEKVAVLRCAPYCIYYHRRLLASESRGKTA